MSRSPDDLTEHENKLLGGWIRGLFEAEGINNELMSTCSPKEFHLLVATLFDQSLKACQAKVLALDTLRGGFECRYSFLPFKQIRWFNSVLCLKLFCASTYYCINLLYQSVTLQLILLE